MGFLSLGSIAHSTAMLNYDIKPLADMDAKQFRRIKVPYKFTNSVPSVRRGKWEAFLECLVAFILNVELFLLKCAESRFKTADKNNDASK